MYRVRGSGWRVLGFRAQHYSDIGKDSSPLCLKQRVAKYLSKTHYTTYYKFLPATMFFFYIP